MKRGKDLYGQNCRHCHGPSVAELKQDLAGEDKHYWVKTKGAGPASDGLWLLRTP